MSSSNTPTPVTTASEPRATIGVQDVVNVQRALNVPADGRSSPPIATSPSPTSNVLHDADAIVSGERWDEHGDPCINLNRIAAMWAATFGWDVTGEDVALAMILFKISRAKAGHTRDNLVDIAGYARTIEMIWNSNSNLPST